jgi:hypothetical protein
MKPNDEIRPEMDKVIQELENKGINPDMNPNVTGLGDVVESALNKFGVTQERYKSWFGLEECSCTKRKKWLNSVFSWNKKQ